MRDCPYCAYPLLRHIEHHEICWFCSHCWTTVPVLSEGKAISNSSMGEL